MPAGVLMIMRFALNDNGGVAFYAFDGCGWIKSGYTPVNWGDNMTTRWQPIGGNVIMLMHYGTNDTYIAKAGNTEICRFRNVSGEQPSAVIYRPGVLFPAYSSVGRNMVSCGSDIRWVRSSTQLDGRVWRPVYHDGIVYLRNKIDGHVDTDIPMRLVRMCTDDALAITIGMDRGVMYGVGYYENLLWCRDLRAPEPFSIDVDWGNCAAGSDAQILADSGLIVMPTREGAIQIVDIRSSAAYYEVSTAPYSEYGIVPLPD